MWSLLLHVAALYSVGIHAAPLVQRDNTGPVLSYLLFNCYSDWWQYRQVNWLHSSYLLNILVLRIVSIAFTRMAPSVAHLEVEIARSSRVLMPRF